ncbi:MAG: YqaE/Pmp3 family membrane protein [Planctomycetota bacterium]
MHIVLKILIAILLPPLSAFLSVGLRAHFWINLALTVLLFYLPGQIHAIWLIVKKAK